MSFQETRRWLRGAVVAAATPFNEDYSLDLPGLEANVDAMVERGIRTGDGVLLVAAAAGEFPVLSIDERRQVMRASVRAAAGRVPVMASVQHTDVREVADPAPVRGRRRHRRRPARPHLLLRGHRGRPVPADRCGRPRNDDPDHGLRHLVGRRGHDGPAILRRLAEFEHVDAVKWSAPDTASFAAGITSIVDRLVVVDNSGLQVWGHALGCARSSPTSPISGRNTASRCGTSSRPATTRPRRPGSSASSTAGARVGRTAELSGGEGHFIKAALELVGMAADRRACPRRASLVPSSTTSGRCSRRPACRWRAARRRSSGRLTADLPLRGDRLVPAVDGARETGAVARARQAFRARRAETLRPRSAPF